MCKHILLPVSNCEDLLVLLHKTSATANDLYKKMPGNDLKAQRDPNCLSKYPS